MSNTKNYFAHGGNELVIGGKLTFLPGATVEGGEGLFDLPAGSPVTALPFLADSEATTVAGLREDYNVDEVKTHLRIQHDEEDDYIESLIKQAQTAAEDYCRVSFEEPDEDGNVPEAPEPVRLAVILMTSFYYENRDIPDMTTYKATRMAFDSLLYPYRDPEKMF